MKRSPHSGPLALVFTGIRPKVVGQHADRPAVALAQGDGSWPCPPFFGAKQFVGGSGQEQRRSRAPDDAALTRRLGRKEETLQGVAKPGLGGAAEDVFLIDVGQDGARNQVPVLIESEGNHWLNIDPILETIAINPCAPIEVVLKGEADQRGNRVDQLHGQIAVGFRSCWLLGVKECASRCKQCG